MFRKVTSSVLYAAKDSIITRQSMFSGPRRGQKRLAVITDYDIYVHVYGICVFAHMCRTMSVQPSCQYYLISFLKIKYSQRDTVKHKGNVASQKFKNSFSLFVIQLRGTKYWRQLQQNAFSCLSNSLSLKLVLQLSSVFFDLISNRQVISITKRFLFVLFYLYFSHENQKKKLQSK